MDSMDEPIDYPPRAVTTPDPSTFNIFDVGKQGSRHFIPRNMIRYLGACGICYDGSTPRRFDGRVYKVMSDDVLCGMVYDAVDSYGLDYLPSKSEMTNIVDASKIMLCGDKMLGFADPRDGEPYSVLIYGKPSGGLYAFDNGILNTAGNFLVPFTDRLLIPSCYNARYDPSVESCSAEAIIENILPNEDTRRFFFEMVGYFLFGNMNPPAIFVIYGPGNTGKSALANMIRTLMGDMVSGLSLKQITQRFMPAMLEGKKLNISGETGEGKDRFTQVDGELIKQLSDGQDILVERKHGHPYYIQNTAKLLFVTNTIPDFGDTSSGLYRRLYTIPCRVSQDPTAQIYEKMTDPESLSWLVNKALDGYVDLLDRGNVFKPSEEMIHEWDSARVQDPFYDFLYNETRATDIHGICSFIMTDAELRFTKTLYDRYRSFCYESGAHPLGSRKFYEKIRNEMEIEIDTRPTNIYVDGTRTSARVFKWKDPPKND